MPLVDVIYLTRKIEFYQISKLKYNARLVCLWCMEMWRNTVSIETELRKQRRNKIVKKMFIKTRYPIRHSYDSLLGLNSFNYLVRERDREINVFERLLSEEQCQKCLFL